MLGLINFGPSSVLVRVMFNFGHIRIDHSRFRFKYDLGTLWIGLILDESSSNWVRVRSGQVRI